MIEELNVDKGIELCVNNGLVSAAYRLPNTQNKVLLVQKDNYTDCDSNLSELLSKQGFMIHPFLSNGSKQQFIRADYLFTDSLSSSELLELEQIKNPEFKLNGEISEQEEKNSFLKLLDLAKQKCISGELKKVVLSRIIHIEGNYLNKISTIFNMLCDTYNNAFVFYFNSGSEIWIGASPEPFLISKDGYFHTTSVAGTRPYNVKNMHIDWTAKEKDEQAIVSDYIQQVLSKFGISNFDKKGPYPKKAGNLLHLRTDFSFYNQLKSEQVSDFLMNLHPTPAVCGIEKSKAYDFILTNEKHNREYYAGFLGPVGIENHFSLFVNLRSMKVLPSQLALFVGSGITSGSIAENEWDEMEMKAETLRTVIS